MNVEPQLNDAQNSVIMQQREVTLHALFYSMLQNSFIACFKTIACNKIKQIINNK